MSVLIPTMIGKHHLKLDMPGEFSNKVLQKCLTTTIWVVPSVLVYAFLNSLMCLLTILLTIAFIGNHPIKGWKIASRILRGER